MLLLIAGCSPDLRIDYGKSSGSAGDQSINGFGVLRRSYEKNGWMTRDVNRLNDRLTNVDAIIWTPKYPDTLERDSTEWFDDWLAEKTRTLIYVVPDEGCEIDYFEAARQLASPKQRLEYRRRAARLETDRILARMRETPIPNNGWFEVQRVSKSQTSVGSSGEWNFQSEADQTVPMRVTFKIVPAATNAPSTQATPPTPPNSWKLPPAITSADVEHTTLMSTADGSPQIVRVTAKEWGDSTIIVVGSGSLLCNYSMANPLGQKIAAQLIAATADSPGTIGFLLTDIQGAYVSEVDPEINSVTGMELLTVWPLNLIMLHLAVLGFVACMVLLPIFGRPRERQEKSSSDFADHLDAVAALMNKSGGEEFARRRISDYMHRIRGETTGPWILTESKPVSNVLPPLNSVVVPPMIATTTSNEPVSDATLPSPANISLTKEIP